jgi:hypothetical protein
MTCLPRHNAAFRPAFKAAARLGIGHLGRAMQYRYKRP